MGINVKLYVHKIIEEIIAIINENLKPFIIIFLTSSSIFLKESKTILITKHHFLNIMIASY